MKQVLSVQDVKKVYRVRKTKGNKQTKLNALDGISFCLNEGEALGIIGASGCGKSTLLKIILGLVKPTSGHITKKELAGFVAQDPYDSLCPAYRVERIIAEPLLYTKRKHRLKDCTEEIKKMMGYVHLDYDTYRQRYPHQLSGGERQRVSIARALVLSPSFLALDEPTSMLDYHVKNDIAKTIRYAAQKTNTAILLVTHDITLAESICDTIAVMCDGKIIEQGETFQILHSPKNTYTKRLIAAGTDIESYWSLQDEVS